MVACYITSSRKDPGCSHDLGFMGLTHASSAVALFLLALVLFPQEALLSLVTGSVAVLALSSLNVVGGAMLNDLDNTTSTAENSLSLLGSLLSAIFRTTSVIVQSSLRSQRDGTEVNPHRGFYHTIPGALLVGGLCYLATTLDLFAVTVPILGTLSSGAFMGILITWMNAHIALTILARGSMKKLKKSGDGLGEVAAAILSLALVVALFSQVPPGVSFRWLGISIAAGMIIHTLGDCFTTAGSPILFPIPVRGKLWWTVRFLKIKAGGVVEQWVFLPAFLLIIIVASVILGLRL